MINRNFKKSIELLLLISNVRTLVDASTNRSVRKQYTEHFMDVVPMDKELSKHGGKSIRYNEADMHLLHEAAHDLLAVVNESIGIGTQKQWTHAMIILRKLAESLKAISVFDFTQ